ncbi:MAG: hypothetical protein KDD44_07970, partial [Bdellovibrionales bacterium]|nr:hypothetical protein [Bdellovibrionales bacterium]
EGSATTVLDEQPSVPRSPTDVQQSKVDLWLHDLEMLRLQAKREYDISVNTDAIGTLCRNGTYSLAECQQAIAAKEQDLNELIVSHKKLKQQSTAQKPNAPAQRQPATTSVTIIERAHGRYPRHHRRSDHFYQRGSEARIRIESGDTTVEGSFGSPHHREGHSHYAAEPEPQQTFTRSRIGSRRINGPK